MGLCLLIGNVPLIPSHIPYPIAIHIARNRILQNYFRCGGRCRWNVNILTIVSKLLLLCLNGSVLFRNRMIEQSRIDIPNIQISNRIIVVRTIHGDMIIMIRYQIHKNVFTIPFHNTIGCRIQYVMDEMRVFEKLLTQNLFQ